MSSLVKRRFELTLYGRLDGDQLDGLRRDLGLVGVGGIGDPVGTELGRRIERDPRHGAVTVAVLTLSRIGVHEWLIAIDAMPRSDISEWERLAEIGAAAAGLVVAERFADEPRHRLEEALLGPDEGQGPGPEPMERPAAARRPRPVPGEWKVLDDNEIVDLAERLQRFTWSWRVDDMLKLGEEFGWAVGSRGSGRLTLDTGLGTADSYLHFHGIDVDCIDIAVTSRVVADDAGNERLRDTFTRVAALLSASLGKPVDSNPFDAVEIQWPAAESTLALSYLPPTVRLVLTSDYVADRPD
ncbi:DUF6301 family protein [Nocardia sp. NPDC051030]|uniref:DUF6301 family protein n=1 Tax=Nocardia sp. NPDC051030 TaxID=3155162 RepID=UPI00341C287D